MICFRLPSRQSARLTPPVPMPSTEKADEMILQDMIQHWSAEEMKACLKILRYVDDRVPPPRHDDTSIPGTRSPRNLSTLISSDTEKLQELMVTHLTPSSGMNMVLIAHLEERFMPRTSSDQLADNLHDFMMETLPSLVKKKVTEQVKKEVPAYMSGHILHVHPSQVQSSYVPEQQHQLYLAMMADPLLQQQDIAIWLALQMKFEKTQGRIVQKVQKTYEYEAYYSEMSSSGQVNVDEPVPYYANYKIAMSLSAVHQEFSDMGKSARFSTWNRKLSTED
ncbi:hypothetical protein Tco_0214713 [Tanacetum coccineum]